jgi:arabinogalactan oligomer/maltooligosaccharide transport system substrate-binding protein
VGEIGDTVIGPVYEARRISRHRGAPATVAVRVLALALAVGACTGGDGTTPATTTPIPTTRPAPTPAPTAPATTSQAPATTSTTAPESGVEVWADPTIVGALESVASDFTARTGIAVAVEERAFASIRADVLAAAVDGSGPDLFVGSHSWTQELVTAGAVAPVVLIPQTVRDAFLAPALEAFTLDARLYAVPYAAETVALWANTSLVGTAVPATFDELLDRCDTLAPDRVCLAVPGGAGLPDAYYQFPIVSAFGGSIFHRVEGVGYDLDSAGIDSPESLVAYQYLADLSLGEYLPPLDYTAAKASFVEGEVAYWLTGLWERADVASAAETRGFEFATLAIPPIEGNLARPFVEVQGVFLAAEASPQAATFLLSTIASADALAELYSGEPQLPTHSDVAATISDPLVVPFADGVAVGIPTPNLVAMTDEVWKIWGDALAEIRDRRVTTPEEAITAAARRIRGMLGIPEPEVPPPIE